MIHFIDDCGLIKNEMCNVPKSLVMSDFFFTGEGGSSL